MRLSRVRTRLAGESGNVLITVVLVSMIIGALAAAALRTGEHAESTSASDRNHQAALAVAEAGVHEAIAQINASPNDYMSCPGDPLLPICRLEASTPEGKYDLIVTRIDDGFVLESGGETGGEVLGRDRRVRITLLPPRLFDANYALFSFTSIDVKNNDDITGDVWANDSVLVRNGTSIQGSVTAATSWIRLESNATIGEFAWSGGFDNGTAKAINLAGGASIGDWAKASVSSPSDPETCTDEDPPDYDIAMANNSDIHGDVTTLGTVSPAGGVVHGQSHFGECTSAPAPKPLPKFSEHAITFDEVFDSVDEFESAWLQSNIDTLQGTIKVNEPSPSQANRIDLTGGTVVGDLTIVTNAPVFTNGIDDDEVAIGPDGALMVVVSHYDPPTATACDVNHDDSDCAIHVKNNFDPSCTTAMLLYADNGPVAVKNNQDACGSIISEGILIKNNQVLTYDERVDRVLGFGDTTYEIARWEECPVSGCAP